MTRTRTKVTAKREKPKVTLSPRLPRREEEEKEGQEEGQKVERQEGKERQERHERQEEKGQQEEKSRRGVASGGRTFQPMEER